jgi:c-di-GMP-specific phosphodiesterase
MRQDAEVIMKLTDADNAADGIFFPALEQNMMGAVLINENDEVMFFNPAAEKLWGYKREEVIGNNIDMLIPRDLRPAHPEYIRHNREGGKARVEGMSRELQLEKKDGSKIWTRFALSKVSAEGKVYYLALVRDASVEMAQNGSRFYCRLFSPAAAPDSSPQHALYRLHGCDECIQDAQDANPAESAYQCYCQ